jgi:hypothetical protein
MKQSEKSSWMYEIRRKKKEGTKRLSELEVV